MKIFSTLKDSEYRSILRNIAQSKVNNADLIVPESITLSEDGKIEELKIQHKLYPEFYCIFKHSPHSIQWAVEMNPIRFGKGPILYHFMNYYTIFLRKDDLREMSFPDWLDSLAEEIEAKEQIKNFFLYKHFFDTNPRITDSFTSEEKIEYNSKLDSVKISIEKHQFEIAEMTANELQEMKTEILQAITHLQEMIDNLNKLDWKNLVLGAVVGYIPTLVLDQESKGQLIHLICQGLGITTAQLNEAFHLGK